MYSVAKMHIKYLLNALKPALIWCKICRLVCFDYSAGKYKISKVQIYLNYLLAFGALLACCYEVKQHITNTKIPSMFKAIGIVQVVALFLVIFVTLIYVSCYQKTYVRLIKETARLDNRFQKLGTKIYYDKTKKSIRKQMALRLTVLILAIGGHLYAGLKRHSYIDNTINYVGFVVNSAICMQVGIFSNIIKERFTILNKTLIEIKDMQAKGDNGGGYIKVINRLFNQMNEIVVLDLYFLKLVMRLHQEVSNVVLYVNKIFGAPLVLLYLNAFQASLLAFYYTDCVAGRFDILQIPATVQVLIISFMFIADATYVFCACNSACEEAKKAGLIIFQYEKDDDNVRQQIDMFSLQMMHTKIEFNACGLFRINYNSIFTLISAFTMNLIILIQFLTEKQFKYCLEIPAEEYDN